MAGVVSIRHMAIAHRPGAGDTFVTLVSSMFANRKPANKGVLHALSERDKRINRPEYRKLAHQLVGELVAGFPDSRILSHPQ